MQMTKFKKRETTNALSVVNHSDTVCNCGKHYGNGVHTPYMWAAICKRMATVKSMKDTNHNTDAMKSYLRDFEFNHGVLPEPPSLTSPELHGYLIQIENQRKPLAIERKDWF